MTQNYRGYWYDTTSNTFSVAGGASTGGTEENAETAAWLSWEGRWGDDEYAFGVDGQYCLFGECLFESGPTGPVTKNLGRTAMCETEDDCKIFDDIDKLTIQSK